MKSSTGLGILGILGAAGMIAVVVLVPKRPDQSPGTDLRLIGFATMALGWGLLKFVKPKNDKSAPLREQDPILSMADVEAFNFGHNYVGTEHLLCALVKMPVSRLETLFKLYCVSLELSAPRFSGS